MDVPNAFIGRKAKPVAADLATALGPAMAWWQTLTDELADCGVGFHEWNTPAQKYGWTLRLKRNKRTILFLSPCKDCFEAMLVLDDRALDAALQSDLPPLVIKRITESPYNIEGATVRLMVKSAADMAIVRRLVAIRLES